MDLTNKIRYSLHHYFLILFHVYCYLPFIIVSEPIGKQRHEEFQLTSQPLVFAVIQPDLMKKYVLKVDGLSYSFDSLVKAIDIAFKLHFVFNLKWGQPNNPLHGVKLVDILKYLVEEFGWQKLADQIDIRCFKSDPSIKSSLKFLRQTQWARDKVERLYLRSIRQRPNR